MDLFWEQKFTVQTRDADFNNKLKISSVFDYMQEAASSHAGHLNLGFKQFKEKNIFWVLTQAKIEMLDYPAFEDEITVRTWPKDKYRLYSLRDFFLYNKGNIFCKASTAWVILNAGTRRVIDSTAIVAGIPYQNQESALDFIPQKMTDNKDALLAYSKEVRYSDVDINKHLNNAKYIEMLFDALDKDFYTGKNVKSLLINFSSETTFGDTVQLWKEQKDNLIFINGLSSEGKKLFQSEITINGI